MAILFAISVVCLFALLGVMLAFGKRVRITLRANPVSSGRGSTLTLLNPSPSRVQRAPRPSSAVYLQDIREIAPRKLPDWRFLIPRSRDRRRLLSAAGPGATERKPPQSSSYGNPVRSDWRYFNKDLGDLSDPYQPAQPEVPQFRRQSF